MKRIENVTIIGVGLIGGSLALALKEAGFAGRITGCDNAAALRNAGSRGALDAAEEDPQTAIRDADLVVLAAPVRANLDLLTSIAPHLPVHSLVTDVGSAKRELVLRAGELFGAGSLRRLLGGHPIAGREVSGVEHADASLFRGAPWVLTPSGGRHALLAPEFSRGLHREFIELLERIGARVVITTPENHDRVLAFTSHLPQLVSTALASTVGDELGGRIELRDLSGRGLREMIRLAKSDPQLWSEITASNAANIRDALLVMEQHLAALRESLGAPGFQEKFKQGSTFDPDAEPSPADGTDPPRFD
jgi:prephenate dehydrogenase